MPRFNLNQKGVAHLLIIIILLGGLVGGLVLIKNPQIFSPKAYNEQVSPLLREQRIHSLRETFRIDEQVADEQVEVVVKDGFFQNGIMIDGELVDGDATVSILGDCLEKDTNYQLSEYGVYPPLCLDEAEQHKTTELLKSGAEFGADFFLPYTQAKEASELGDLIAEVRSLLQESSISQRVSTSEVSGPDSSFDGYVVTLIRIKELEQDVRENPDGSGNLTVEQEQARRKYALALRDLWERQHNVLLGLTYAAAGLYIDKPLRVVGTAASPIVKPVATNIGKAVEPVYQPIFKFVKHTWNRFFKKVPQDILELQEVIDARGYKVPLSVVDVPRPQTSNPIDWVKAEEWISAHPEGVARDAARALVQETRHISQEEFETALKQAALKFNGEMGAEDYVIFVQPRKSNKWVAEMVLPDMDYLPEQVYDLTPFNHLENSLDGIANIRRLVFFDDAIYSGSQMNGYILGSIYDAKKVGADPANFTVDIIVPFTTEFGRDHILNTIKNVYPEMKVTLHTTEVMPSATETLSKHGPEVVDYVGKLYQGTDSKTLTYFDHKIPDHVSTTYEAYAGHVHDADGKILKNADDFVIQIPFIQKTIPPYK